MYVFQFFRLRIETGGNLPARAVLVVHDAFRAVAALAGIEEIAFFIRRKTHPCAQKVGDRFARGTQHALDRVAVIFVMPRPQRVLEKNIVVAVPFEDADSALREVRIAVLRAFLRDEKDILVPRQKQCRVEPRYARARDDDIVFFFQLQHTVFFHEFVL